MPAQVDKNIFKDALIQLGHNPSDYEGKKISLKKVEEIYGIFDEALFEAIKKDLLHAFYDVKSDTIFVDALEIAYFYFCVKSYSDLYSK